ncbi:NUDIX domain-containing protein [Solibacillus sp. CAU 1738]|uniref:NUDIX hydrolase n=1 Tax=Solibacillus sp. CAU 1738 TaxID=3140363 RepID=UPI0032618219
MPEILKIFDENYKQIGTKSRDEVHKQGYWHEVFHCWVLQKKEDEWLIYFQLRSKNKKDYPNQFDITAAGHLLATESVEDGVRELQEEIGLTVAFNDLTSLGVIQYVIDNKYIKDYEFANVFIYELQGSIEDFQLQIEELDGMFYGKLADFMELAKGLRENIQITGYQLDNNKKRYINKHVALTDMAALPQQYLHSFLSKLENKL